MTAPVLYKQVALADLIEDAADALLDWKIQIERLNEFLGPDSPVAPFIKEKAKLIEGYAILFDRCAVVVHGVMVPMQEQVSALGN